MRIIEKQIEKIILVVSVTIGSIAQANPPSAPKGQEEAVVWIVGDYLQGEYSETSWGSGVIVAPGVVVTANHVTPPNPKSLKVYFMNKGAWSDRPARIAYSSPEADIAVLSVDFFETDFFTTMGICQDGIITKGGAAVIWGFPLVEDPRPDYFNRYDVEVLPRTDKIFESRLTKYNLKVPSDLKYVSQRAKKQSLFFDGRAYHGNSGGPIVFNLSDNKKCVGGILSAAGGAKSAAGDQMEISGRAENIGLLPSLSSLKSNDPREVQKYFSGQKALPAKWRNE